MSKSCLNHVPFAQGSLMGHCRLLVEVQFLTHKSLQNGTAKERDNLKGRLSSTSS
jgi:hypothetical protein